ncbi:MAG: hypothetical protein U1A72_14235 [Sulfuritalea sp.]|nr:hypothetical protein [Sulfuritalea sp.]
MIFLLSGLFVAPWALAQLPDPTRPPAQMMTPDSGGAAAPVESGMQTVIVRRKGKSGAVINGQYVEVGGKLGDKRVTRISEREVVLQGEGGREVIRLIPSIEKTPVVKPAAEGVARRRPTGIGEQ